MAFERDPWREFISGSMGRPPTFLILLVASLALGCLADTIGSLRPWVEHLRLDPAVWNDGELWRLVTYGLVGRGGVGPWTIVQLVLAYWLGLQMVLWMRARRAQTILIGGVAISGIVAAVTQFASDAFGGPSCEYDPFWLIQGQNVIIAVGLASFAARNRYSTVTHSPYLLGLPIPTRWLVPLQIMMAIFGAAATGDIGGLFGVLTATAWGWTASARRWSSRQRGSKPGSTPGSN